MDLPKQSPKRRKQTLKKILAQNQYNVKGVGGSPIQKSPYQITARNVTRFQEGQGSNWEKSNLYRTILETQRNKMDDVEPPTFTAFDTSSALH